MIPLKRKVKNSKLLLLFSFAAFIIQQHFLGNMTALLMFPKHETIDSLDHLLKHPGLIPVRATSPLAFNCVEV